jgi:hypothetical protein
MEVSGQLHAPATLHPRKDWGLSGPQSRSGRSGEEKNLWPDGNRTPVVHPLVVTITVKYVGMRWILGTFDDDNFWDFSQCSPHPLQELQSKDLRCY